MISQDEAREDARRKQLVEDFVADIPPDKTPEKVYWVGYKVVEEGIVLLRHHERTVISQGDNFNPVTQETRDCYTSWAAAQAVLVQTLQRNSVAATDALSKAVNDLVKGK